jgi:signal transduction histidine kinase/ActR/RegA family two-component response regulator
MPLRTVKVPLEMEPLFEEAEEVVSAYFNARKDDPQKGTIEISDQRYVLVRGASLSVEFFTVVRDLLGTGREQEADQFTRNILFDLAHAVGKADATNFHDTMGLVDPIARLSAGPVHFSHAGWAYVDISPTSVPVSGPDFYLLYDHPYSFESDAWIRAGKTSDSPVCIMNAGYSSGWCEESFGVRLVAAEIMCRGKGDDCCRFIMAPPDRLEQHIADYTSAARVSGESIAVNAVPELFERKRLEDELREARENLERRVEERTEELRAANQRLQEEIANRARVERMLTQSQKLEALGRLAGGIAHDFNNLLSAMGGYTELLRDEIPDGSEAAGFADEIAESVNRAAGLTQQLLVFSRQRVATPRVVDLSRLVHRLENLLRRLIGEDIELRTKLCKEVCCVEADTTQLEQVVINLAVNARDAMPDGGLLTIEVRREVDPESGCEFVCLGVEDTGNGMDDGALEHIFDPFFTTKKPGEGTGLGLAMVYGTVTRYEGSIRVRSEVAEGTRFDVRLPWVDREAEVSSRPSRAPRTSRRIRRILVVEDDETVRVLLARAFEDVGHELHIAASGEEALEIWQAHSAEIDAVVTDVIMPNMSGPNLVEHLRRTRAELPVIYISGYASDRVGDGALRDPNTVFMQKPFDLRGLIAKLGAMLDERD